MVYHREAHCAISKENRCWPRTEEIRPRAVARASGLFFSFVSHASVWPSPIFTSASPSFLPVNASCSYLPTNCSRSYLRIFCPPLCYESEDESLSFFVFVTFAVEKFPRARVRFSEKSCRLGTTGRSSTRKVIDAVTYFFGAAESRTIRPTCKIPILSKIHKQVVIKPCHVLSDIFAVQSYLPIGDKK